MQDFQFSSYKLWKYIKISVDVNLSSSYYRLLYFKFLRSLLGQKEKSLANFQDKIFKK